MTGERPGASNVLHLRGMMRYLEDDDLLLFVGSPDLPDLRALSASGLYLNELCMHDCSRELVLAGSQKSDELKSAIFRVRPAILCTLPLASSSSRRNPYWPLAVCIFARAIV